MANRIKYILIAIFIPIILSSVFVLLYEGHPNILSSMPSWNDEDLYFNQLKSIVAYGRPLGYFGFDGSHAPNLTFDAHGWFILIPYALFCKVFGVHFFSVAITNHILIMIVIATYLLLFKPELKQGLIFAILFFSPMVIFYISTSMVEGSNYFYGGMCAILMAYIIKTGGGIPSRIALVILCIFATCSKPSWAVLFFPMFMILLDKIIKRTGLRIAISTISTIICGGIGYLFFHAFVADYFDGTYAINEFFENISVSGIVPAAISLLKQFIRNVYETFFSLYDPFREISLIYIVICILASFAFLIYLRKESFAYIPLLFIVGTIGGVILLYLPGEVALRAIYPGAVFSFAFILSWGEWKLKRPAYAALAILLIGTYVLQCFGATLDRDWYNKDEADYYNELEKKMSVIEIDEKSKKPWDNTLAIQVSTTFNNRQPEMMAPAGVGINFYQDFMDESKSLEARYVLTWADSDEAYYLIDKGFEPITEEFMDIIILKRH